MYHVRVYSSDGYRAGSFMHETESLARNQYDSYLDNPDIRDYCMLTLTHESRSTIEYIATHNWENGEWKDD